MATKKVVDERCMTDADWEKMKPIFSKSEFRRPMLMDRAFMEDLLRVRHRAGVPVFISSSHRTDEENVTAGGAADSAHTDVPCKSVDIVPPRKPDPKDPNWNYARYRIVQAAMELGFVRIGIYPNGSIHLDKTEDTRPAPRLWVVVSNKAKPKP